MIKARDLQHLRVLLEYYVALYIHSDKQPNNTQIMTKKIVEAFSTLVGCYTEGGIESQVLNYDKIIIINIINYY